MIRLSGNSATSMRLKFLLKAGVPVPSALDTSARDRRAYRLVRRAVSSFCFS